MWLTFPQSAAVCYVCVQMDAMCCLGRTSNWILGVLVVCFLVPKETKCNLKPGWAGWITGFMYPSPMSLKNKHMHGAHITLHYITVLHSAVVKSLIALQLSHMTLGIHWWRPPPPCSLLSSSLFQWMRRPVVLPSGDKWASIRTRLWLELFRVKAWWGRGRFATWPVALASHIQYIQV